MTPPSPPHEMRVVTYPPVQMSVLVPLGPVPARPPEALAPWVTPLYQGDRLVDWHLHVERGVDDPGGLVHATQQFGQWRSSWRRRWLLDDARLALAVARWARQRGVGTLVGELLAADRSALSAAEVVKACDEVRELRRSMRWDEGSAWALDSPTGDRGGAVLPEPPPTVVAEGAGMVVVADDAGLWLHHGRWVPVREWTHSVGVEIDGESYGDAVARLLRGLAPGLDAVDVVAAPRDEVADRVLRPLSSALAAAVEHHAPLQAVLHPHGELS